MFVGKLSYCSMDLAQVRGKGTVDALVDGLTDIDI